MRLPSFTVPLILGFCSLSAAHAQRAVETDPMPRAVLDGMTASSVTCADPGQCPTSVGMLVGAWEQFNDESDGSSPTEYRTLSCTGTLISNSLFLTNRHCIPPEVLLEEVSPRRRLVVAFPAVGSLPAQVIGVRQVLLTSDEADIPTEHLPDYAILTLSRDAARGTTAVSRSSPVMDQSYRIASVDRTGSHGFSKEGQIVVTEVRARQGLYGLPRRYEDWPALFGVGMGRLRIGHSGSAILNAAGEMVGLLYAVHRMSADPSDDSTYSEGYAFTAACLPVIRSLPGPMPAQCGSHDWYDVWALRDLSSR